MILHITVKPNSKTDQIFVEENGGIKVKIRAQPVDGKANKYLIDYLSAVLEIPKSQIEILKGSNQSNKKINIEADEKMILERLKKYKAGDKK